ncbi:hypothetical protein EVAR_11952_1 [Eumeta japonica]|uniref:Uncharacterized protein n=1 Tax=Eumeta variegata TaxID=151549 RepID=A0A4C1U4N9_EUMVA|nr:hypothetical protein EVAR_11952_1 [Eumeta japonica]
MIDKGHGATARAPRLVVYQETLERRRDRWRPSGGSPILRLILELLEKPPLNLCLSMQQLLKYNNLAGVDQQPAMKMIHVKFAKKPLGQFMLEQGRPIDMVYGHGVFEISIRVPYRTGPIGFETAGRNSLVRPRRSWARITVSLSRRRPRASRV